MIEKYTNHTIENGKIYRGTSTRRVIQPDSNGVYKIRFKQEDHYHTLEELLHPVQKDPPKKKYVSKKRNMVDGTFKALLIKYNTDRSVYTRWLSKNRQQEISDLTYEEHEVVLSDRRDAIDLKRATNIKELCDGLGVNYNGYRTHVRNQGLVYSELKPIDHRRYIDEYKTQLNVRKGVSVKSICDRYGVDYYKYKGKLVTLGLKYGDLTVEDHEFQIVLYRDNLISKEAAEV
jgi:hypothetical protein